MLKYDRNKRYIVDQEDVQVIAELTDNALAEQGEALVHCYNHHVPLVKALEEMIAAYSGDREMSAEECLDACNSAKQVLTSARKGEP